MLTKSRLLINQLLYFCIAGAFAVFLDYLVYKLTFNSLGSIFSKKKANYGQPQITRFLGANHTILGGK